GFQVWKVGEKVEQVLVRRCWAETKRPDQHFHHRHHGHERWVAPGPDELINDVRRQRRYRVTPIEIGDQDTGIQEDALAIGKRPFQRRLAHAPQAARSPRMYAATSSAVP